MTRDERRYRSHAKFMRRLHERWNEEGWLWHPWAPHYHFRHGRPLMDVPEAYTTLHGVFYDPIFQRIYKDTPTWHGHRETSFSDYRHGPFWRLKLRAATEADARENRKLPKKCPGRLRVVRERCFCGFIFGIMIVAKINWRRTFMLRNQDCPNCYPKKKEPELVAAAV